MSPIDLGYVANNYATGQKGEEKVENRSAASERTKLSGFSVTALQNRRPSEMKEAIDQRSKCKTLSFSM